jgi:hypothetical protein
VAARQPVQQQPVAQRAAHHVALGILARQAYHQVRAGLVTTHRQARRAQCASQQVATGEQFAARPAQVPGEIAGHHERGEYPLAGRGWPHSGGGPARADRVHHLAGCRHPPDA